MLRATLVIVFAAAAALAARAADSAELGRRLFQDGRRPDGTPLAAVAGAANLPLPAGFVACARCHGSDARGRTEGGVTAGDIRAGTLTTPYAVALEGGRLRPTYDAASFAVALTRGLDPAGQPLPAAMPRYTLSRDEAAALFAYLGRIDAASTAGVDATTLRIGFLPADDPALAAATERVLQSRFAELNAQGGIFRRRLVLVSHPAPADVLVILDDNLASPARADLTPTIALHAVCAAEPGAARESFGVFSAPPDSPFALLSADARSTYLRCLGGAPASASESLHQLTLLAAADLLVEALARTGRDLTGPRLVAALESTGDYRSGFGFIAGFTPARHVAGAASISPAAPHSFTNR